MVCKFEERGVVMSLTNEQMEVLEDFKKSEKPYCILTRWGLAYANTEKEIIELMENENEFCELRKKEMK